MRSFFESEALRIWVNGDKEQVNQYVEFRHEFYVDRFPDNNGELYITVDSDYAIWFNGVFLDCGQFDDYPDKKSYDVIRVNNLIKPGRNVLCIQVYYQGESSYQYYCGEPGLKYMFFVDGIKIYSNEKVICRKSHTYKNGLVARITPQLSFTFEYNGQREDDWIAIEYKPDFTWGPAEIMKPVDYSMRWEKYYQRPIEKLKVLKSIPSKIKTQGVFRRCFENETNLADMMQRDFLSTCRRDEIFLNGSENKLPATYGLEVDPKVFTSGQGVYIILDLDREETGFFEFEIDSESGVIVDIAYGEHLEDLRVRSCVGGRNFACRYICKVGLQKFTHYFKRFAGRYIELHISGVKEKFILYYAGLQPCEYPVSLRGSFSCPDSLYNKIYDISVRTLHLCMHEHYEDCPWREQALYSMDSRIQALCGYYCFGEYDFPAASFDLLGHGLKDDGYIEMCAPAETEITIPSFSMAWIVEAAEHYMYSGRLDTAKIAMPVIRKMMSVYLKSMKDGLLPSPEGERFWHFYDWAEGLDGTLDNKASRAVINVLRSTRYDAVFNLFFCIALDSAAFLAVECGELQESHNYLEVMEKLKKTIHKVFWDEEKQVYKTYSDDDNCRHYAELTQAMALCSGVCPPETASALRGKLACEDNGLVETTLTYSIFKFQALLQESEIYSRTVFDRIALDWGHMLFNGATSFWETIRGADDFGGAGSLCHGWSAVPVYFYYAYILGVKPVEPGFKRFKVEPVYNALDRASGNVPTPYGEIFVDWKKVGDKIVCDVCSAAGTIRV
jgi:alpha-L-rhamnosidase